MKDDIRVPLHELQADVDYLFGRVAADGACASAMAASVKEKLAKVEAGIEQLEAALREIIAVPTGYHAAAQMEGIARAALAPEQDE